MKSFVIATLATIGAFFLLPMITRGVFHAAFGIGGMAISWLMVACVAVFLFAFSGVGKKSRR